MLCRLVATLSALLALSAPASAQTRLNVAIGADVNVVEVHKSLLGPGFKTDATILKCENAVCAIVAQGDDVDTPEKQEREPSPSHSD